MNRIGENLIHFAPNEELVRAFVNAHVRFVVIGGLAVAWHCAERQADDMDLLIEPSAENSARIEAALKSVGISNLQPGAFARDGLQVPLKQHLYAELLTPRTEGPTFEEVESQAVDGRLFNLPVQIASRTTLLKMKSIAVAAGDSSAEKHQRDIDLLHQHDA
ncbi:MAG: hypothetical protein AB3X44_20085 [Leptothrix sp. (in: b-proteobacteria)]